MSERNFFIINESAPNSCFKNMFEELIQFGSAQKIGIHINVKEYDGELNELLEHLNVKENYFSISDDCPGSLETDDLFDLAGYMNKKECIEGFEFLNQIVKIIFSDPSVKDVDFYISDVPAVLPSDYEIVKVKGKNLAEALAGEIFSKKNWYIGIPTACFKILEH